MNQIEKSKRKDIVDIHLVLEEKRNSLIDKIEQNCKELNDLGLKVKFDMDSKTLDFNLEKLNNV